MKVLKGIVFPDIHTPKHDEPAVHAALQFTKSYNPDIFIHLGDLCDFNSLSRFDIINEDEIVSFNEEVLAANLMLDRIEDVLPRKCKKYFIEGNHDQRPQLYRNNNWDKKIHKLIGPLEDCKDLFHLKDRGWHFTERSGALKLGHAIFKHGLYTGIYHARKHLEKHFKTTIYGHTHNWQVHSRNGMDEHPVAGISIGTLSRFDLEYLKGEPADWTHMIMAIDFFPDGTFTPLCIPIINGRFSFNGKVYDGQA